MKALCQCLLSGLEMSHSLLKAYCYLSLAPTGNRQSTLKLDAITYTLPQGTG